MKCLVVSISQRVFDVLAVVAHSASTDHFDRADAKYRAGIAIAIRLESRHIADERLGGVSEAFERNVGVWQEIL